MEALLCANYHSLGLLWGEQGRDVGILQHYLGNLVVLRQTKLWLRVRGSSKDPHLNRAGPMRSAVGAVVYRGLPLSLLTPWHSSFKVGRPNATVRMIPASKKNNHHLCTKLADKADSQRLL